MSHGRAAIRSALCASVLLATPGPYRLAAAEAPAPARAPADNIARALPESKRPVLFNTPEADQILGTLQVFPPDNPWNEDVSGLPLHPNSRKIIASIGAEKPLAFNWDMGFVLVPPDQP